MNQGLDWNDVFGEVEKVESDNNLISSHFEHSILDPTQSNEQIKNVLGKNLFEHIKQSQHLVRSQSLSPVAKKQLKETLYFFINTAKRDMTLLEGAQLLLMTTKFLLGHFSHSQQQALDKMLRSSRKIIKNHHAKMQSLHIHSQLKSKTMIANKMKADIHQNILNLIYEENFTEAVGLLLGFHYVYTQEQAALLLTAAKQLNIEHSEAFIELLNYRLYAQHSTHPEKIDYHVIKDNFFLTNKSIFPSPQNRLALLNLNLEELVQIQHALCESKAKQRLTDLIEEFNAFIDSIDSSPN